MKTATKFLLIVVGLLVLTEFGLRGWFLLRYHSLLGTAFSRPTASLTNSISGKPLLIMMGHSNSVDSAEDMITDLSPRHT
jgi:hypothetical protein